MTTLPTPPEFVRSRRGLIVATLLISLYFVTFLWGMWPKGIFAFGLNMTVFLFLLLGLFCYAAKGRRILQHHNAYWLLPLSMMILSFALYDNPFLKVITLLVGPVVMALFYNYSFLEERGRIHWNLPFLGAMLNRIVAVLDKLPYSASVLSHCILPSSKVSPIVRKVLTGLLLFILIASFFIIPLLSSADPLFAERIGDLANWVIDFISMVYVVKVIFALFLSWIFLSMCTAWARGFSVKQTEINYHMEPIAAGIVMGGVLLLYLLFLATQLEHLWVSGLPLDFATTESFVKSGFWQLFFLSVINALFFFLYYRRTPKVLQHLLGCFTVASLFLLLSAAQRMFLYVYYYGLSYEKFFASYTVLYALILFVWLLFALIRKKRSDIFYFLIMLFVWMYGFLTIMPVEKMIFQGNVYLATRADSRIDLLELQMLSGDVWKDVKMYSSRDEWLQDWDYWFSSRENLHFRKAWYEWNLSDLR